MRYFIVFLSLISILLSAEEVNLQGKASFIKSDNNRYYVGDNPDWKKPDVVTDNWPEFDHKTRAMDYRGLFWMSFDIYLEVKEVPILDYEYNLHMLAAQEVYWDGQLIGRNGLPGETKEEEIPGNIWTTYLIPNHLITDGKHTLTIRGSNHFRRDNMKFLREGWIQPFDPGFRYVSFWSLVPSLLVSIAAVVGLYFLMLYFTEDRQPEHLVFFVLLESLTLLGFAIQWGHLVGYTYDLEPVNLALEFGSMIVVLIFLPLYFLLKHKAPRPWLWILGAALITWAIGKIFPSVQIMAWLGSFGLAFFASVYFGVKNKPFLWWESAGLFVCFVALLQQDLEDIFIFFPTLFSLVLLTHAIAMQRRKYSLQEASYIETQLRAELLRKHIQPHFLLNTLTSLMEWVETDTQKSTLFIAELAEEFRLMSKVSSQKLIDLNTEIALCRKHLSIMSLRLQKNCTLEVQGIEGDEKIPPALFHTLLENAFSHNAYEYDPVYFILAKHAGPGQKTEFTFTAPRARQQTEKFRQLGTGTGQKYIEARLRQAFGKHWCLLESQNESKWVTRISLDYDQLKT